MTAGDQWLVRTLLGPARLDQRVRELEESPAHAVDDGTAALRRVERDLHDGAQVRLAALANGLGMAKEKLGEDGSPLDEIEAARIRDLVDAAHRGAKEALIELRDLARGIDPPVLDSGLAEALTTLAAQSIIPVELTADIGERPTPRSRPSPTSVPRAARQRGQAQRRQSRAPGPDAARGHAPAAGQRRRRGRRQPGAGQRPARLVHGCGPWTAAST